MAAHNEDDLWDMDDDALEAAFKEAQAQESSPETDIETADEPDTDSVDDNEEIEVTDDIDNDNDTDDEDITDGSEQPDLSQDSDHDASTDSEEDDVEDENTDESEEDNPDGDADTGTEENSETTDADKDEEQPTQKYSVRANGKDYDFSSEEIVKQFPKVFGQAMDYTKKMQTIKPWRKTIDAIEGAKLSHDDVSLMIDVLKGDKEAINEVLKRTGTDTLELNTEEDSNYVVKDYGRDEGALAIEDVVSEINQDPEYVTTHNILAKEWDDKSWAAVAEKPEMIRLLHTDVKSGMYNTIQPLAEKLKVFDGNSKTDLEYYKEAAQQHFNEVNKQKTFADNQASKQQKAKEEKQRTSDENAARIARAKEQSNKRSESKKASAKRKAAAPTKNSSADRVVDYLDESDEQFDDWYKKLQDSM